MNKYIRKYHLITVLFFHRKISYPVHFRWYIHFLQKSELFFLNLELGFRNFLLNKSPQLQW